MIAFRWLKGFLSYCKVILLVECDCMPRSQTQAARAHYMGVSPTKAKSMVSSCRPTLDPFRHRKQHICRYTKFNNLYRVFWFPGC